MASNRQMALMSLCLVIGTTSAWAAPPAFLMENKKLVGIVFFGSQRGLGGVVFLDYRATQGRSLDLAIDRLAFAAAQRDPRPQSDASALLSEEAPSDLARRLGLPR